MKNCFFLTPYGEVLFFLRQPPSLLLLLSSGPGPAPHQAKSTGIRGTGSRINHCVIDRFSIKSMCSWILFPGRQFQVHNDISRVLSTSVSYPGYFCCSHSKCQVHNSPQSECEVHNRISGVLSTLVFYPCYLCCPDPKSQVHNDICSCFKRLRTKSGSK